MGLETGTPKVRTRKRDSFLIDIAVWLFLISKRNETKKLPWAYSTP